MEDGTSRQKYDDQGRLLMQRPRNGTGSSQFAGVQPVHRKWRAGIFYEKKPRYLGLYDTEEDAADAVKQAREEIAAGTFKPREPTCRKAEQNSASCVGPLPDSSTSSAASSDGIADAGRSELATGMGEVSGDTERDDLSGGIMRNSEAIARSNEVDPGMEGLSTDIEIGDLSAGTVDDCIDGSHFEHVLSLGSRCVVARLLVNMQLRLYAGPLDYVYSSAEMVRHCLADNFCAFLDGEKIISAGKAFGHEIYGQMLDRHVVFPHHEPCGRDRAHFIRCTERFLQILGSSERKLFLAAYLVKSRKELEHVRSNKDTGCTIMEVKKLFEAICGRGVQNFVFAAVYVIEAMQGIPEVASRPALRLIHDSGPGTGRLIIHELHCIGTCTGLYFKDPADARGIETWLTGGGKRKFELRPDPLPPDNSALSRRRTMGDPVLGKDGQPVPMKRPDCSKPSQRKRRKQTAVSDCSSRQNLQPLEEDANHTLSSEVDGNESDLTATADVDGMKTLVPPPDDRSDRAQDTVTTRSNHLDDASGTSEGSSMLHGGISLGRVHDAVCADDDEEDDRRVMAEIESLCAGSGDHTSDYNNVELLLEDLAAKSLQEFMQGLDKVHAEKALSCDAARQNGDYELMRVLETSARTYEEEARRRHDADEHGLLGLERPSSAAQERGVEPQRLVELGFQLRHAEEAVQHCSSMDACVEWILSQGSDKNVSAGLGVGPASGPELALSTPQNAGVQTLRQLVELGFPRSQAERAMQRHSSVEACVEWILQQG